MRIFMTYAREDWEFAWKLGARLREAGHEVWSDYENVFPGDNWPLAVGKALDDSEVIVLLLSPELVRSEFFSSLVSYAISGTKYKNRLVPVVVRPTEDYPSVLAILNMIQSGGDVDRTSKEIVKRLETGPVEAAR
jgi:hypothetical protein